MVFSKYLGLLGISLVLVSNLAHAEQADPKALAKAQHMLRQMSSEREAMQAQIAQLKTELETLKAKKTSSDGVLVKTKESLREIQENLDKTLAEKQTFEASAADRGRQLEQCTIKNTKLYELNGELLQRYARKGVMDAMAKREPFTGLKKVEMENLLQELQDKNDEQRVNTDTSVHASGEPTARVP